MSLLCSDGQPGVFLPYQQQPPLKPKEYRPPDMSRDLCQRGCGKVAWQHFPVLDRPGGAR